MKKIGTSHRPERLIRFAYAAGRVSLVLAIALILTGGVALAAPLSATAPGLGAAASYSVLGKGGVTNTGSTVLSGKVGADSSITGFPPGTALEKVVAPAVNGAEADALTAYGTLAAQGVTRSFDLAGTNTVTPGVYDVAASTLNGTLTLDGPGVYIFRSTSSITASGNMKFSPGTDVCNVNVFWQIPTSMTINAGAAMVGTIIANTGAITFGEGASLVGRALSLTKQVTLINNHIYVPNCPVAVVATTVPATAVATAKPTGTLPTTTSLLATAVATKTAIPATSQPAATSVPALLPVAGADLIETRAQASEQMLPINLINKGLGVLGLGLALLGFILISKHKS